jgi:hypothetical protein
MLRRAASSSSAASDGAGGSADGAERVATSKLISQGHENFDLIFMMLMGIRTSVGKFANVPSRELRPADFDQKWDGDFLARGSADTPAHSNQDFRFKDFSPLVFRQIRERFGVNAEEYLLSLTSEYVLVEMFTNSKSGSFFFYSADYRFILKTCTKREAAFLIGALPQYHAHLMSNRYTLLCRFFGLHRVHLPTALGRKVYFVVMGNVFPIDKPVRAPHFAQGRTRPRRAASRRGHTTQPHAGAPHARRYTSGTTLRGRRAGASRRSRSAPTRQWCLRTSTGSAPGVSSTLAPTRSGGYLHRSRRTAPSWRVSR